ncbi:MAG: PAS domain-containing protein, partial [Desulfuromonadaceae bacterium]|nr:PAS domain-containing protein [Desulfuromonadaceae bacterium]
MTYANKAFQFMCGVASLDGFIGKPAFGLWENTEQAQAILPALAGGGTWSGELSGVRSDGSRFAIQASVFQIRNQQDKPLNLMGVYIDISDRKEAEQGLRESKDMLNAILEGISDPIFMMDRSLRILWANDTAKGFFGAKLVGKKCYQAIHRRTSPCLPSPCSALLCFQDGALQEDEQAWIGSDGDKRLFHCTANVA